MLGLVMFCIVQIQPQMRTNTEVDSMHTFDTQFTPVIEITGRTDKTITKRNYDL